MVSARYKEVLSSSVCVNNLVLGSVEDSTVHRQHCRDAEYLIRTLVPTDHHHQITTTVTTTVYNNNYNSVSHQTLVPTDHHHQITTTVTTTVYNNNYNSVSHQNTCTYRPPPSDHYYCYYYRTDFTDTRTALRLFSVFQFFF